MRDAAALTSCTSAYPPISLREQDVFQRSRCAAGTHIVFIGTSGLGSMVMRGQLTQSVLNQSFARHGAQSSYIVVNSPHNTSSMSNMIEGHFDSIGAPSACVIIKYSVAWVGAACRRRGALVLVDSIDNHRAYSQATLNNEHYAAMDAVIVQTEAHAAMLASWGHLAVVLPHPHGNLGEWGVAGEVRPQLRGVGFVAADQRNMPTREDMNIILRACCRANVTLYHVSSRTSGLGIKPYTNHNCSEVIRPDVIKGTGESFPASATCAMRQGENRAPPSFAATLSSVDTLQIRDPTGQRRYYDSTQLLSLVDVGLVWRPGHQQGGNIAISNRPPTRLHWWWSHGIPAIGYPMNAYVDAAKRADYPNWLLNLTSAEHIEGALRSLRPPEERSCLQRIARRGAHLSSPWYSSIELLAAICAIGERCGQPLQQAAGTFTA